MGSDAKYTAHFETYLLTEKRVAQNTFMAYKRDLAQLFSYLISQKLGLEDCGISHLKSFLAFLKNKDITPKSIARKISTLKLFFGFLHERFKLPNIADGLVFPKLEQKLPRYLTDEEIYQLLLACEHDKSTKGIRNKVMIHVLYASGMRVSELAGLTADQIHFDTGFVHLSGKGNKERMIPLPKATLDILKYYLNSVQPKLIPKNYVVQKPYVFGTAVNGEFRPITRQSIWNIVKKIMKEAGITKDISPHSLRHSLATHLLKNGANIRSLQMLLGHENLTTVQIYTHLEVSQLRDIYDKAHPRSK